MKKITLLLTALILFACAPALDKSLMRAGDRNVPFYELRTNPDAYKGKLYILGGVIVQTRFVQNGSEVEVYSLPVDSRGYVEDHDLSTGRILAVYPRERGLLDPVVYKKGREVSIAGVFIDSRKSKIDEMEYVYPVFEIRQIHLREEPRDYSPYPYYYPYNYYYPYWYPAWGHWGAPPPGLW